MSEILIELIVNIIILSVYIKVVIHRPLREVRLRLQDQKCSDLSSHSHEIHFGHALLTVTELITLL